MINEIEDQQDLAWSDIPWTDPRWLDPRPLVYNAAENAEVFAMNVWHKFQSWKVVGFSNLPQFLQVQGTEIFSILTRPLHRTMISSRRVIDLPCRASKSVSSRYSVSTPRLATSGLTSLGLSFLSQSPSSSTLSPSVTTVISISRFVSNLKTKHFRF